MKKAVKIFGGQLTGLASALGIANEVDKHINYGEDGFNRLGRDRMGYDRNGYDKSGYDRQGYNKSGYDREGYDRSGYNVDGFDRNRYNREGRNSRGFDKNGYDCEGFDRKGYDYQGYDRSGNDRSGHSKVYYTRKIQEMRENCDSAHRQMKDNHFEYALRDIRVGIEKGVKAALAHTLGKGYENNTLNQNIDICSRKNIFPNDFVEKLKGAKKHCNASAHEDCDKEYNQVHFCYKVLRELTDVLQKKTYASITER